MIDKVLRCPFCGKLYKLFGYSAADQSACPKCVAEAEKNTRSEWQVNK